MICFGNYLTEDNGFDNIAESEYDIEPSTAYAIMAENEINYNKIMQAIGLSELAAYCTTGEVIYEAADISSLFEKVKAFIKKIFDKILALIKKAIAVLDRFILSDKAFVKKYEKTILAADLKDFEYEGYEFTTDTSYVLSKLDLDMLELTDVKSKYKDADSTDRMDILRGSIFKKGKLDSSEFHEEIFKFFRNDEDSKTPIKVEPRDIINEISTGKKTVSQAKKDFTAFKKLYGEHVRKIESKQRESNDKLKKGKSEDAEANAEEIIDIAMWLDVVKNKLNLITSVENGRLTALKAQNRQAKSIATKLVVRSYKHESANVGFTHEACGSFLSNVSLI